MKGDAVKAVPRVRQNGVVDSSGKVHGSLARAGRGLFWCLARAGKVKGQTPNVAKQIKKKKPRRRAHKRLQYNRRFVTADMRMMWIEIAKYLGGKSLVKLASTCKWFYKVITEECVWKYACLRDLGMPDPGDVSFKWKNIYASAFDDTHSYLFREYEKHIEWKRIGAFFLDSPAALLNGKLTFPRRIAKDTIEKMLENIGLCVITNIKTGIWIADTQILHCPVCGLNTCDGTMLVLDTRHFELFLSQGYQNGSWDFAQLGSRKIKRGVDTASGAIADLKHLNDASTTETFKTETWFREDKDSQTSGKITLHAVAFKTNNVEDNDGLKLKFHIMRAGTDGPIVAIRISQHLL
ncbi:putative F-box protein At3g61730 [Silene latifolia]|uniref:putative F-box protein At3g61730 n=1 Tax=Silene latifolia TaxID=37657 RepID=UPI003D77CA01